MDKTYKLENSNIIDDNNLNSSIETDTDDIVKDIKCQKNKLFRQSRINELRSMYNTYNFNGNIYLFGYGAIGRPLLFMIMKIVKINPKNITIIDKIDKKDELKDLLNLGVTFVKSLINKDTYKNLLKNIKKGDLIIDCAYNIYTYDFLNLCQEKGCHYINSCIEDWDYKGIVDPIEYSLYHKHLEIQNLNKSFKTKNYNAIVSMGCNPGNVSIWNKLGLEKINEKYHHKSKTFAELAQKLGVQVIHISERDTQRSKKAKRVNEYCNTWSSDGEAYFEEALGCVELSWGTHERKTPNDVVKLENNFLILDKMGLYTYAQSVVPLYGRFIGNIVRHDESHTIGKTLEIKDSNGKIIYKPSVYYVYHSSNAARMSIEELKERDYEYQTNWRLMTDEIVNGRDILGLTYFLNNKEVYWIGSILCIDEARELFEYKFNEWVNATNVQVMAGYLGGVLHLIDLINSNNNLGLMTPEDLPYKKIFKLTKPFFGEFIFKKIEDFQLTKYDKKFTNKNSYTDNWQFENFLV